MLASKRILLIIGGGIAAYKSLDLIRRDPGSARALAAAEDAVAADAADPDEAAERVIAAFRR